MATNALTPVQTVNEIGGVEVVGPNVIVSLESYGADMRVLLTRHATTELIQHLIRVVDDMFAADKQRNVLPFPQAARA